MDLRGVRSRREGSTFRLSSGQIHSEFLPTDQLCSLAWPLLLGPVASLGLDRGAMSLTGKSSSGVQHEGVWQAFLCSWNTAVFIV